MRAKLIEQIKSKIEKTLKNHLREEGIELYLAANDNMAYGQDPLVELEAMEDCLLQGSELLSEIRVILGVLGKPWQCDVLVSGIYEALHPHYITQRELTILLISLHVEAAHCVRPRRLKKRAIIKYVVEETSASLKEATEQDNADIADAECC